MMKRRSIISVITALLLVTLLAIPAYALTIPLFNWNPITHSTKTIQERGTTNGTLIFDGVATASAAGKFEAVLQKKLGLIWYDAGVAIHDVYYHANTTWHQREKKDVQGQYFKLTWKNLDTGGTYRVLLRNPTVLQTITISEARFDIQ